MSSENADKTPNDQSASPLSADVKIAAHRAEHQQKFKKTLTFIGLALFVVIAAFAAMQVMSGSDSKDGNVQTIEQVSNLSDQEITEYREAFKQALTDYEINIQPDVDKILVSNWEPQQATELALLKEQTLTAFAQGSYLQANELFENLKNASTALIQKWRKQTDEYLALASQAFEDDQIPLAQLNVNKALELMPTNRQAIALQTRIDAHAEVASLLSDLQIAKVENNLPKQIDLLSGIIELDPQRSELNDDLASVKTTYDQQRLTQLLKEAESALQKNSLNKAQDYVNQAKAIKPNSKGAQVIEDRIKQAQSTQSLSQIKQQLATLKAQDKWQEVASISAKSLSKHPNDSELLNYQEQAQSVLTAKKSLQIFIARPERIADGNIRLAASKAVQNAFVAASLSSSLQQQIQQVAQTIETYSEPVKVTVNSDGNTYIIVIGVGHVGQHEQKVIELMPGDYVLQGRRDGYKNKRLSFTVKANKSISLNLVCDEKL